MVRPVLLLTVNVSLPVVPTTRTESVPPRPLMVSGELIGNVPRFTTGPLLVESVTLNVPLLLVLEYVSTNASFPAVPLRESSTEDSKAPISTMPN